MPEAIQKLQPHRALSLRGFEFGSSAAITQASETACKVSGIFRESGHFAVLQLYQADNQFEHPRMRYLPDTDFSGMVLQFDVRYTGLQPIDSPKFPTIDWPYLDVKRPDGTTARIPLFDHATYVSGDFAAALQLFTIYDNGMVEYDRITVWFQNLSFDYIVPKVTVAYQFFAAGIGTVHSITIAGSVRSYTEVGGESSADIAAALVSLINASDANCTAAQGVPSHQVNLRSKKDDATGFGVTSSVDATTYTLYHVQATTVARNLRDQVNNLDWPAQGPILAIHAELAGAHHTQTWALIRIWAARYGLVSTVGDLVTRQSGMNFAGILPGAAIFLNGVQYQVEAVLSPTELRVSTQIPGINSGVKYLANRGGYDGNMVTLLVRAKNARLTGDQTFKRLASGSSDATWRISLDFTALGIDQVREMWLTFAPRLPQEPGVGYLAQEWKAEFTNWTVTGANRALQVAGPGSVRIEENDYWCAYAGSSWVRLPEVVPNPYGFFSKGFCQRASTVGDSVTVRYHCQYAHDLYLGTQVYTDRGVVGVSLDGDAATTVETYQDEAAALPARRRLRQTVPAGAHTVVLTLNSGQYFYFDFLEAAVLSDVPDAPGTYALAPATDYDTDVSYKVSPQRLLWWFDKLGWQGRMNHYVGVFWWDQRIEIGRVSPSVRVEFAGAFDTGTGLGNGDQIFLTIGGQDIGKTVFPADDLYSIAFHFACFINETFIGVYATVSGNVLEIFNRSTASAYSFTFGSRIEGYQGGPPLGTGELRVSGSLQGAVPGIWTVDPAQTPAIVKGALDWHTDFFAEVAARGRRVVVAFSMEVVNPPAAWAARYRDGTAVETSTGFGTLTSTHCAFGTGIRAQQTAAYANLAELMAVAGLTPELQFGEFTWWYFRGPAAQATELRTMGYYDAETQAAALAALGRELWVFTDPDENPAAHQADADFLQARLLAYVDALMVGIRSYQPLVQFEVLLPLDVNGTVPSPISAVGGRLNHHVNIPPAWRVKQGSLLDVLKIEALAFGTTDRNFDLALQAMREMLPGWPLASLYYLVPVQNGGCPWERELRAALDEGLGINTWAIDHYLYFGWDPGIPPARVGAVAV